MSGKQYGTFRHEGYKFTVWLPAGPPPSWTLVVSLGDETIRTETIPMMFEPRFGPDVADVQTLDERVDAIILELGLAPMQETT